MSGFEPMFMAQAFAPTAAAAIAPTAAATIGAEIGTAALLGEVAGTGMMMGLPTLGAAFAPTAMNGLAALAPEVAATLGGSIAPYVTPALEGLSAAQGTNLLNNALPNMLSPDQIAKMVNPATDLVANAPNLGQGLTQATYENTVPKMFQNALAGGADQATGDALVRAAAQQPTLYNEAAMKGVFDAYKQAAPVTQELVSQASVAEPFASNSSLYNLKAPGYEALNAPMSNMVPSKYALGNQLADYKLAGSVPSGAATQTAAGQPSLFDKGIKLIKDNPMTSLSMGMNAMKLMGGKSKGGEDEDEEYDGPLSKFKYDPSRYVPGSVAPPTPYKPVYKDYRKAGGGVVELMSDQNAIGANTGYPMADINKGAYATPYQTPISRNMLTGVSDTGVDPMTGEMQFAGGGIADLGGYADYAGGGRMLKGPGDGMSDNIPATIAGKQPARLANEEFVIPADVVSHLGNGSSEAGAKQLYKMMDRVRQARTGKKAQGRQIKAAKLMPA